MNLSDSEISQSLKFSLRDSAFSAMSYSLTSLFLIAFAVSMGADHLFVGLLSSIPMLFWSITQIPASKLIERKGLRKKVTLVSITASRMVWFLVFLLPFMNVSDRLFLLLVFATLSSLLSAVSNPGWYSWLGDLVPARIRGVHFSSRMKVYTIFSVMALIISIIVFEIFPRSGSNGFQILFLMGALSGLASSYYMSRMKEPEYRKEEGKVNHRMISEEFLSRKRLGKLLMIFFVWNFGVMLSAPFYVVRLLEYMGADYTWVSIQAIVSCVSMIAFQSFWGRYSDHFGNKIIISFCALGAAFYPLIWIFAEVPVHIIPIEIIGGISWGGFNLAYFNYLIEISPRGKRPSYTAAFYAIMGISGAFAPIAGALISDIFATSGFLMLTGLETVFFLSWVIRLGGAVMFLKLLENIRIHQKVKMSWVLRDMVRYGHRRTTSMIYTTRQMGRRTIFLSGNEVRRGLREMIKISRNIRTEGRLISKLGLAAGKDLEEMARDIENEIKHMHKSVPSGFRVTEKHKQKKEARRFRMGMKSLKRKLFLTERSAISSYQKLERANEPEIRKITKKLEAIKDPARLLRKRFRKLEKRRRKVTEKQTYA